MNRLSNSCFHSLLVLALFTSHSFAGNCIHEMALGNAQERMSTSPRWEEVVMDGLAIHFLRTVREGRSLVTLPVGSAVTPILDSVRTDYSKVISALVGKKHTIIYDADSIEASWMESQIPSQQRIGISAFRQSHDENLVLKIRNPFTRLQAFSMAQQVISTRRSAVSAALVVFGSARHLFDAGFKVPAPKELKDKKKLQRPLQLPKEKWSSLPKDFPEGYGELNPMKFSSQELLSSLSTVEIWELSQMADQMLLAETTLDDVESEKRAVIFGWSIDYDEFKPLVKATAENLSDSGFSVTTGGSGGYMKVANRAAKEKGGISIGIPIVGLQRLANEQRVFHEYHTVTVPTLSYQVRISSLLYKQNIVVNVPGSSGTAQEIATSILEMAAPNPNWPIHKMYFVSNSFYRYNLNWLKEHFLPFELEKRCELIDDERKFPKLWTEM